MAHDLFPYPSHRTTLYARNVVATSQSLAAQAGLHILRQGGNAVDAAIATAACLTVVEPTSNGLGSDAFAILHDGRAIHALNASGRSPRAWTPDRFAHLPTMPTLGWDSVTVPGAISAWTTLHERFGKLPFEALLEPAIHYAEHGFPVSPITARAWQDQLPKYLNSPTWLATFTTPPPAPPQSPGSSPPGSPPPTPHPRAPQAGELFRLPHHATTLREIARTHGQSFYTGDLAHHIAAHARDTGGRLTAQDLRDHTPDWVTPLSTSYNDLDVHEIPPNGQGIATLIALGLLRHLGFPSRLPGDGGTSVPSSPQYPVDSPDSLHLQIEAMKIAFAEAHAHVADPAHMRVRADQLLDDAFLSRRAAQIDLHRAATPTTQLTPDHGTVYLATADASGMMVSFIQSNYAGFGSGIVVPHTGIALQNRASGFRTDPTHPNGVAGHKRPYHTLIPGFATRNGQPELAFGVMGGHMQPQGHLQILLRLYTYHQDLQPALDAPRWYVHENFHLSLEAGTPPETVEALKQRGHVILNQTDYPLYGGGQLIRKLHGTYAAATDWRKDGAAVGY